METVKVEMPRSEARELYRDYKKHQHYSSPIDQEIQRTYQLIAQGRVVIRALDSVVAAGVGADGFPKLALVRADSEYCRVHMHRPTQRDARCGVIMSFKNLRARGRGSRAGPQQRVDFPQGSFIWAHSPGDWSAYGEAIVPIIPAPLRPKRGLANYHILFEAEWSRVVPKDPLLLRRIGKGDLWLVCAAWDLTEVERAALQARVH
jgi:hypothetical protein